MSWRDSLRDASFRGVPFHVMSHEASFGRRTVTHEYPLKDKPYVEDLGRRARSINLEAIVIGPDYMAARDAVIKAFEQAGAGTLVHPYLGEMQVVATDQIRISESTDQGGMARISITLVESGELTFPAATVDTARQVSTAAASASGDLASGFSDRFTTDGLPAFVREGAALNLTDALNQISAIGNFPGVDALAKSDFLTDITGALNGIQSLISVPSNLALRVQSSIAALRALAPNPRAAFDALSKLFDFSPVRSGGVASTPARTQAVANTAALVELVQASAAIESAVALTEVEFGNLTDSQAYRSTVADTLDVIMNETANDALFVSLQDLRATVVRDVQARSGSLARQIAYVPPATVPALVLAYRLYGSVNREAEILALNRIVHPGFVPGHLPVQVLADV